MVAAVNYDHGHFEGRSQAVLVVTILFCALATIFVWLRAISRSVIVKNVTSDDWIMAVAWLITVGLTISICYGAAWGLGRHEPDIPPEWQSSLKKADYAFSVLYFAALTATKDSILAFYLSLAKTSRTFQYSCIATLAIVNAGGLALIFVTVFQCHPVTAAFTVLSNSGNEQCTDILTIYLASVPLNLVTDLAILFLPLPILTRMRLPTKQKIILVVIFSFGIFVAVVDVVRLSYLQSAAETRLAEIQQQGTSGSVAYDEGDASWYLSFSYMWSAIEVDVGIMCACVPALKPLAARFLPGLLQSHRDRDDAEDADHANLPIRREKAPIAPEPVHIANSGPQVPIAMESDVQMGMQEFLDMPRAPASAGPDARMDMMDFLTTPDMHDLPPHHIERTTTALTNTTRHTRPRSPAFFDFVDMRQRKTLTQLTNRECIWPITVVTVLFFIWGFEYGLLAQLNAEFQNVAKMTPGQSTGIHSAYFAGYAVAPTLVGWPVLKHWGFKFCFPIGLCIYATGLLIFWPAAVLTSWPAFIVSNFIAGFGLSILEVAANPWIALCGPPQYGEVRLNFSQGVQAIGSVVAPLIADKAFFGKSLHAPSLINTQWAYLGIALATALMAMAYYYIPLPEANDLELDDAAERIDGANFARSFNIRIVWIVLGLGVFAQFCYVGGQEVIATTFNAYLTAITPTLNIPNYLAISHTAFAVARFTAAGLGFFIRPRLLLAFFFTGVIVFTSLAIHFRGIGHPTGVAMLICVFFCEGPLFSLIFAQSLRGLGRHTKLASVAITTAVSGGAVFSPISSAIANDSAMNAPRAIIVAAAVFSAGAIYAVLLNILPNARRLVDPIKDYTLESRPCSTTSGNSNFGGKRIRMQFWHVGKHSDAQSPQDSSVRHLRVESRERCRSAESELQ